MIKRLVSIVAFIVVLYYFANAFVDAADYEYQKQLQTGTAYSEQLQNRH